MHKTTTMDEIWVTVLGFDDYEVSNLGNVRRKERRRIRKDGKIGLFKSKKMFPSDNGRGYIQVTLTRDKQRYCKLVHRLVYESFNGSVTSSTKYSIDHLNNNRSDNRLENLQFVTHRENVSRRWAMKRDLPTGVKKSSANSYKATARVGDKEVAIGSFKTALEASAAYQSFISTLTD